MTLHLAGDLEHRAVDADETTGVYERAEPETGGYGGIKHLQARWQATVKGSVDLKQLLLARMWIG